MQLQEKSAIVTGAASGIDADVSFENWRRILAKL